MFLLGEIRISCILICVLCTCIQIAITADEYSSAVKAEAITSSCYSILPQHFPSNTKLDDRLIAALRCGLPGVLISYNWKELESSLEGVERPNNVLTHYQIKTIDKDKLQIPYDLVNPDNPNQLASGLHWNDTIKVVQRFKEILSKFVPLIVKNGAFLISIGYDVDTWLLTNTDEFEGFTQFVKEMRDHVKSINSTLMLGVSICYSCVANKCNLVHPLFEACDAAIITPSNVGSKKSTFEKLTDSIAVAGTKLVVMQDLGSVPSKSPSATLSKESPRTYLVSSVRHMTEEDTSIADTWKLIPKWMRATLFLILITFCYL